MMSRIPTITEEIQKLPTNKRKPRSVDSYSQAILSSDKMSHKPCYIPRRAGTPVLQESSLNVRSASLEPEVFYSPKHKSKGTGNNNVTNRRIKRASLSPQRDLWMQSHGDKSRDMKNEKLKREYERKLQEKNKEINDLREKTREYEQLVNNLEEFLGCYPSVQVLSELIPSTGVVDEVSYVSLLVDHIVLKALFSLQEQALTSHSGTQVKPIQPVFPVPVLTSHGEISRLTDVLISQPFTDQSTHLSSSSTDTMNTIIPVSQIVPDDSLTLDKTITQYSQTDITSIATQTELTMSYQSTMIRGTQTDPELNCNDLLSPESVRSLDSSSQTSHLQQKLEAMTISNELLQSSLDAARRQIASLEITVANQREEIMSKEGQITVISNRVATLMKSFESTQSDTLQYKGLYHRSLEQCAILQEQLDQFNCLFTKLETLLKLQNQVNSQEKHNKLLLETWLHNLFNWESNYIQKKQEVVLLKTAYDSSIKECSHLRDMNHSLELSHRDFEQQLARQISLVAVSMAKEKLLLEEIETLQNSLKEQKVECQELHGKVAQLLDMFRHSHDEYLETAEFAEVERQTLLEANKELEVEVKRLTSELQKGETEFKKLVNYIKDYQSKSTHKTELLKSNLSKADAEIDELDKLIEHIRQVMHDNISVISDCEPLISLLKQIDVNDPAP